MERDESRSPSDALVFFGATGDLAYKKIFPSLHNMVKRNTLDVPVIGVAKSGWTVEQLRERAKDSITKHGGGVDDEAFQRLCDLLQYIDGDYKDEKTYQAIRTQLGDAQLPTHYLAIPPSMFSVVVQGLGKSGAAKNARVILEKPFGRDLLTARRNIESVSNLLDRVVVCSKPVLDRSSRRPDGYRPSPR